VLHLNVCRAERELLTEYENNPNKSRVHLEVQAVYLLESSIGKSTKEGSDNAKKITQVTQEIIWLFFE
jgi:hypothetical protein